MLQPSDVESYRMASLRRILAEAVSRGTARHVLGAFVEALGVWDDVRADAYAASASNGFFFRYVSPMGAPADPVPAELDDTVVPYDNEIVRCSRADVDRMGIEAESSDVLLLRVQTGDVTWVLLFTGAIDEHEQDRLTRYAELLRDSLNEVVTTALGRVVATLSGDPLPADEALADGAQAALARLAAFASGYQSALAVSAATGRQMLVAGNADLLQAFGDRSRSDRLFVTASDPRSVMTVAVERQRPRFTAFERALLQAGASALHPRVQNAIESSRAGERRRQYRPVDSLFDQLAADTVGAGQPASVIVVSVETATLGPGVLQVWLGRIREQLRAGDFAGILSHREIAVLLSDASADQAAVVSARLQQLLPPKQGTGLPVHPSF